MTWYSIREAAPLLGVAQQTLYLLIESGRLDHRRIGLRPGRGKIQVSDVGIAKFLESCEIAAKDSAAIVPAGDKRGRPKTRTISGRPDGKPIRSDWFPKT